MLSGLRTAYPSPRHGVESGVQEGSKVRAQVVLPPPLEIGRMSWKF